MEFAVIKTGGKQYKITSGVTLKIERIKGELTKGDTVTFDEVLLIDNGKETKIGNPTIKGATVEATFDGEGRAPKVTVIKYKQKSRYFKKRGHKQVFARVKIGAIK